MMRYIFRNSTRLAGQARARCCNVVHQSKLEGDEQRWTARRQHQRRQYLDTDIRLSHATLFWSGIRVHQHRNEFIQLLPFTKKSGIQFGQCHVNSFSHFALQLLHCWKCDFSFLGWWIQPTWPLRGRLSGSSVSKQLSVVTLTVSLWTCGWNGKMHGVVTT